jgi:CBS domain-containing protein
VLNKEIISASIPSLNFDDKVFHALNLMSDLHIAHLAVVEDDKLMGLVSESDLLNVTDDANTSLSQLENLFSKITVHAQTHFIEAVQKVNEFNLTIIPVTDKENEYIGSISATDLLQQMGKFAGANEPGGIIVLEMEQINFSFSELSKIVETNDAKITQLNTYNDLQSGGFYVTIKINKFEIADIIATFQRYDYYIKYSFGEELYENNLRSNYEHLMNYLNI